MRIILLFITLLFAYGYHLISAWYPDVSWMQADFMSWVWPSLAAFLSIVTILFVSLNRKSDPVQGAWGIMAFVGCMLIVPLILAREQQAQQDAAASESIRQSRELMRLQRLKKAEEVRELIADRKERAKTDRFVQYEGKIPADLIDRMRELDSAMLNDVKSHSDAYKQAMDANPSLGPDAWVRFRRIDQLSLEIAKHKELYERTRAFSQFVESFEEQYSAKITALNLQPPADRIAIAELQRILQEWERSKIYELRRLDVRLIGSAIQALNLLSDEWGRWSFDPREQELVFENKDKEAQFAEAILLIKAIMEEVSMITDDTPTEDQDP